MTSLPLRSTSHTPLSPQEYLAHCGEVFTVFDQQDSGNVSYGVRIGTERYFVKTAGRPDDAAPYLKFEDRIALLRNAVALYNSCPHPALARLLNVVGSPEGPLLVYEWVEGELLGVPRDKRDDPESSFQRFRALPVEEIVRALDLIFALHHDLAERGWVMADFYDGCLLYDFARQRLRVMDLDTYHSGPFTNTMGRMFGSSRFMAPEEFQLGATIDERTSVFTLGRTVAVFLSDGTLERTPFRGNDSQYAVMRQACQEDRAARFADVDSLHRAWAESTTPDACRLEMQKCA